MRWNDVESAQPRLAHLGRQRLIEPGVVLVATVRKDGTPRLSPVEAVIMDGNLWLSMMHGSRKAQDLLRDDRILVHSIVTNRDGAEGEYKIRGAAVSETDQAIHERYAELVARTLGWEPIPGKFHLFTVQVDVITYIRYENGDQYMTTWPPGEEVVRRKETATSLEPPVPTRQWLDVTS